MNQRPTWDNTVLYFSLVESSRNKDRIFEYDALSNNHLNAIMTILRSENKAPQSALKQTLKELRDACIIQVIRPGIYRILVNEQEALQLLQSYGSKRMSKGEQMVARILDSMGIQYTREKTFKELRMVRLLRYDFHFELSNVGFAIEYYGKQHYLAVDIFGGIPEMIRTNIHDKVKRTFATDNNINMLILRYDSDHVDASNKIEHFIQDGLHKGGITPDIDLSNIPKEQISNGTIQMPNVKSNHPVLQIVKADDVSKPLVKIPTPISTNTLEEILEKFVTFMTLIPEERLQEQVTSTSISEETLNAFSRWFENLKAIGQDLLKQMY